MPTENRSSNTEMVSVLQREDRYIVIKRSDLERISAQHRFEFSKASRVVHERMFAAGAPARRFLVIESDWPEYEPTWAAIERRVAGAQAPQPHPDPIAWMVGTAFWWTKEEAERDAAETGLPIVGLGPMTGSEPAEPHQGEPVAWMYTRPEVEWPAFYDKRKDATGWKETPLYTHADPGEVERLVAANTEYARRHLEHQAEVERLRSELAQCEAMADMVAEREWAEHVGTGPVSNKVEAAFTQLHNDLHEADEKLAGRDALLTDISKRHWSGVDFDLPADLVDRIKALSANAEPEATS